MLRKLRIAFAAVFALSLTALLLDTTACRSCKICERNCKSGCIDISRHRIDYSRCVTCMDCVEKCPFDALHYRCVIGKH